MESDCPECFANPSKCGRLDRCLSCEFRESCEFCAKDDGSSCDRRLGHVSFDRYSYSREIATRDRAVDPPPEDGKPVLPFAPSGGGDAETLQVMEYLLDLDNYTAELLHEVLHGNCNTASDLARKFGISRQAVHRKIVDCCTLHPELRHLFIARLYRCRRLMKDSKRLKPKESPDLIQMELF